MNISELIIFEIVTAFLFWLLLVIDGATIFCAILWVHHWVMNLRSSWRSRLMDIGICLGYVILFVIINMPLVVLGVVVKGITNRCMGVPEGDEYSNYVIVVLWLLLVEISFTIFVILILLLQLYAKSEEIETLTRTCRVCDICNEPMQYCDGHASNFPPVSKTDDIM